MSASIDTKKDLGKSDELLQLVTFHIGDEEFAVDILNIQGINRMVDITKVPNTPDFVEGIINLRGKVLPVINLRRKLGMPDKEYDNHTRFIVVEFQNRVLGFIVDSVNEVLRINRNLTEPPPEISSNIDSQFITAIGKLDDRLLILLNLERVLTITDHEVLAEITQKAE